MNLTDRKLSGESAQSSQSTKKSVYLMVMSRSNHTVLFVRSSSLTMIWYLGEHHSTLMPFAKAICAVRNGLQHFGTVFVEVGQWGIPLPVLFETKRLQTYMTEISAGLQTLTMRFSIGREKIF